MQRYRVALQYFGTPYSGWQRNPDSLKPAVQDVVEAAIHTFVGKENFEPCYVSSRTDAGMQREGACVKVRIVRLSELNVSDQTSINPNPPPPIGVHALHNVLHVDLLRRSRQVGEILEPHAPETVCRALNALLRGSGVHILDCQAEPREGDGLFHARYAAHERKYLYRILTGRSVFEADRAWCLDLRGSQQNLNVEAMQAAAQMLVGKKHDFSSFRGRDCQAKSPMKIIKSIEVVRVRPELAHPSETYGELLHVHVRAKSFLYHMVRNIVGALQAVATGRLPPAAMKEILEARDRSVAPAMAPAQGLFLERVLYEEDLRREEVAREEAWMKGGGERRGSDFEGKGG